MNAIEIRNFTKFYGKARGVTNIDLKVEEGDFFGFIGPNGAGKSTTIRTMLGLISATEGLVKLFGKDIKKDKTAILSRIGYLPSETMFYNNMKVKDVLKFSADLHGKDCSKEAERLCGRLNLDVTRKVEELSLGNRKKVGIVCAMQHEPELYIMDEPTSGLDPLMQRELYTLLKEKNEKGATVFLSSHILTEVQKYCKHAAVIREGKILECDTVANLGNTGTKIVTVEGINKLPLLDQVKNVTRYDHAIRFMYKGSADTLLKELSKFEIKDITIEDPDLEEVFMHYYEKGEK